MENAQRLSDAGEPPVEPLYTVDDAKGAAACFRPCRYGECVTIADGLRVRFSDIGHLLGSACIEFWLREDGTEKKKIVFSGDVGNIDQPILNDPLPVAETDYLVVESTYGNRLHDKPKDVRAERQRFCSGRSTAAAARHYPGLRRGPDAGASVPAARDQAEKACAWTRRFPGLP